MFFSYLNKCRIQYTCRYGIELAGISSDGDPKLLSAMIYQASLMNGIPNIQDVIHLLNKGRNRLLKPDILLPMGTKKVSINDLRFLLRNVHKSVHVLSYCDVFPIDRMNYGSFEKILQNRVISALQERVPNSEATVQYLLAFRDIGDSFFKYDIHPLERIHLIMRSTFFFRIWRKFIQSSRSYNFKDNFITYNAYMCTELNAKGLIDLVRKFRDRGTPELFLPSLFDSQACERFFRLFRSMGSTQFTKINFSLLELIYMIGRVDVQTDISYCKLNIEGIKLPHKRKLKTAIHQLPTDEFMQLLQKQKMKRSKSQ